jgi:hypothetical protein
MVPETLIVSQGEVDGLIQLRNDLLQSVWKFAVTTESLLHSCLLLQGLTDRTQAEDEILSHIPVALAAATRGMMNSLQLIDRCNALLGIKVGSSQPPRPASAGCLSFSSFLPFLLFFLGGGSPAACSFPRELGGLRTRSVASSTLILK